VEAEKILKALIAWARLKDRVKLYGFTVDSGYSAQDRKHYVAFKAVIICDTARDCKMISDGLRYLFEHFEEIKNVPDLRRISV